MTEQQVKYYANSMLGVGDFDPSLITDMTNATANLVNAFTGKNSSSSGSTSTEPSTPQIIYVPQTTTSSNDNTMLYIAGAALLAMVAFMAFKK